MVGCSHEANEVPEEVPDLLNELMSIDRIGLAFPRLLLEFSEDAAGFAD